MAPIDSKIISFENFYFLLSMTRQASMRVVLMLFLCSFSLAAIQREITYSPNLVYNPDFLIPTLPSNTYMKSFPPNIMGWKCLTYCFLQNLPVICWWYSRPCNISYQQGIDLNSQCIFQNVTQTIYINEPGEHIFHFQWIIPLFAAQGKQFTVWLNETVIIQITHNTTAIVPNQLEFTYDFPMGNLTISMMMTGGANDCWGTVVTNVSVFKVYRPIENPQFESFVSLMMNNNATTFMNQLPGNRIFLNFLVNQYRLMDRMEFYYYHKQNLTFYSQVFLSNINQMMLGKGSLLQLVVQGCEDSSSFCESINSGYNTLIGALDQKYNYTSSDFLEKNPNGIGFYANNLDFFFFELPFILAIHFLLNIIFKILFNYRVSLILRKYSLYGTLLFIIYEGNVEHFAFYFFAECKQFFSENFIHKMSNIVMVVFFFVLVVFVIGGMLWFRFHYRKLTKYFVEDFDVSAFSVVLESFERSIFPLLFGSIHILLIEDLFLQTTFLGILEVSYLSVRLICIRSSEAHRRLKIWFSVTASLLRLSFIFTFYFYESRDQSVLVNYIHMNTIVIYLINGFMQFLEEIFNSSLELKEAIQKWCKRRSKEQEQELKEKDESEINYSVQLVKQESGATTPLKSTLRTTERTPTRTILKERSKHQLVQNKKVRIFTQKQQKTSGIFMVKDGKVFSLSNLNEPICNSEVQFMAKRNTEKHKTVRQTIKKKTMLVKKTSNSCKQMKQ